jgi:hypothetical protein
MQYSYSYCKGMKLYIDWFETNHFNFQLFGLNISTNYIYIPFLIILLISCICPIIYLYTDIETSV